MRNNFVKVNLIIFVFLFCTSQQIFAVQEGPLIDRGDGYAVGRPMQKEEKNSNAEFDILKSIYEFFSPDGTDTEHDITPDYSNQYCVWNGEPGNQNSSNPNAFSLSNPYRQCDYRNNPLHSDNGNCSICKAGCGLVSVANVSSMFGKQIDPIQVNEMYRRNGYYAGCGGSSLGNAKKALDQLGFVTSNYIFQNPGKIDFVANDIRNYVKTGSVVFALTHFCSGGCGHFIVITDIDNQNRVKSYDPYYEPGSRVQPIDYPGRYPLPSYIYAFAVRKP